MYRGYRSSYCNTSGPYRVQLNNLSRLSVMKFHGIRYRPSRLRCYTWWNLWLLRWIEREVHWCELVCGTLTSYEINLQVKWFEGYLAYCTYWYLFLSFFYILYSLENLSNYLAESNLRFFFSFLEAFCS